MQPSPTPRPARPATAALRDCRLIMNLGKGGVGKSVVSAAMALVLSRRGQRTLLVQLDAKDRISEYLGVEPIGDTPAEALPGLWCVNITPQKAQEEYVLQRMPFKAIYKLVFQNRLVASFLEGVPAISDLSLFTSLEHHYNLRRRDGSFAWDRIVVDMPPTGHGLFFLSIPRAVSQALTSGPVHDNANRMQAMLADRRNCALNLVTLPEEMPVTETLETARTLVRDMDIPPALLLVNRFDPCLVNPDHVQPLLALARATGAQGGPLAMVEEDLLRFQRQQGYVAQLAKDLDAPLATLPDIVTGRFGRCELQALVDRCEDLC